MDAMDPRERTREWLEADGLGGFASGTVSTIRTRRYHALLLAAARPPVGRTVLVNGVEAWVDTPAGSCPISSQVYGPDVVHPDGASRLRDFRAEPWPRWTYHLDDGTPIEHEVFAVRGAPVVVLCWRLAARVKGVRLSVRPLMSGRDFHALHHQNGSFRFEPELTPAGALRWRPYDGVPAVVAVADATYDHEPHWYRNFRYAEECARGLDDGEDLAAPGVLRFDLSDAGEVFLVLAAETPALEEHLATSRLGLDAVRLRAAEKKRRNELGPPLHRAADAYIVRRGEGQTLIAGYPWFGDWGRDTFIALRGLCLATGRLDVAGRILGEWAGAVSEGMLPNLFPDGSAEPEYNTADASLWYVIAVSEYVEAMKRAKRRLAPGELLRLRAAVESILDGHVRGTRFGIHADTDGLLAAGQAGYQLTWMDAKVGSWVVTPRIGKPVEIQALWLNALKVASEWAPRYLDVLDRGLRSFETKFWNEEAGCLFDVVDNDHQAGWNDASFRPNQIFAVGGLPMPLLSVERARRVVDAVEERLLTPLGLRSLAPGEPGYCPRYEGGVLQRDGAYHRGTVWPWLIGPFVEAWVRVRGARPGVIAEARARFLAPLLAHLDDAGLGHVSEIADAEPPHVPRGCPFQAWSVGELLRLDQVVLGAAATQREPAETARRPTGPPPAATPRRRAPGRPAPEA
jgi:predicted glycogen debranching enzyme